MSHNGKWFFAILVVAAIGVMAARAGAYVLQGPHVLELMAHKMGSQAKLLISQELLLFPPDPASGPKVLPETVHLAAPGFFRSDLEAPSLHRIHVYARGDSLTVLDGQRVAQPGLSFDRYKDLLIHRTRQDLMEVLRQSQVEPSVSSLGLFQGEVAYVIGADFPDLATPQVWVGKENLLPSRFILPSGDSLLEIRYLKWQAVGESWWPREIEFHQNERLIRKVRVHQVETDPQQDGRLFDIRDLKTAFPPAVPDVPAGMNGVDELEQAVEDFQRILE